MKHERCLILPGLTAADWTALMALVRALDITVDGLRDLIDNPGNDEPVSDEMRTLRVAFDALNPAILAAAREGRS